MDMRPGQQHARYGLLRHRAAVRGSSGRRLRGDTIALTRHTMAGVPRGERIQAQIAAEYRPLEKIFTDPPDLLVVTGSNPIESRIEDEPYWSDLHGLLKWGERERAGDGAVLPVGPRRPGRLRRPRADHPAGQVHGRLRPAGRSGPPAGRRVPRPRVPAPLAAQHRARRGGGSPPATRWRCSRKRWGGAWSPRRWASARSCWCRPIPSTTRRASSANTSAMCGATPATCTTSCPVYQ